MDGPLPRVPVGHAHPRPDAAVVEELVESAGSVLPAGVVPDVEPIVRVLTAVEAECPGCRSLIARWLAGSGDRWTVVALGTRVVRDAERLYEAMRGSWASRRIVVQAMLREAFGPATAVVLGPLVDGDGDGALAADLFAALDPDQRLEVVGDVMVALWQSPELTGAPLPGTLPADPQFW